MRARWRRLLFFLRADYKMRRQLKHIRNLDETPEPGHNVEGEFWPY